MDKRLNVSVKKNVKRYKPFITLTVLMIILLAYGLVQIYSNQHQSHLAHKRLSLPKINTHQDKAKLVTENIGWTTVITHSGDSLASLFKQVGLSSQLLQTLLLNNKHAKILSNIKTNQRIRFLIEKNVLQKMIIPVSTTQFLVIYKKDNQYISTLKSRKMSTHTDYLTATVKGSLYASAKRANIPYKLIKQMTDIFNWEMDFIKDIRSGDRFTILYEAFYIEDKLVSIGDIIAVSYNNNGKKHQAIRHIDQSGDTEYFTPEGTSLKKAFSRYPVKFSHISSTYSLSRYHPILHYRRPHKGVDLAAPIGTPIYATGDGRVEQIERDSAYGNMVKVSHNKMYASLYAHLLKFQKGLSRGDRVKRGQVIGYVGQTGLADGPHCHYEFHVNHQPKNPSTIALPRSSPIGRREMPSFKAKAATLFAQLKLFEEAHLIASVKKSTKTA